MPSAAAIGPMLRTWRAHRRFSQLGLALAAGTSARHLSFLETGKAQPSREMVLRLAERLDVPLRTRNEMLLAAGFAPEFPERSLDSAALSAARRAIELVLEGHLPFPALAVDRHWNLVSANAAATGLLTGVAASLLVPPINVLRVSLHPEGMAPRIVNLAEWRVHVLERLRHQGEATGDPELKRLESELAEYPAPAMSPAERDRVGDYVVPMVLRTETGTLSFFSTTTVFGTPRDVTLSEIAIEAFFPADHETARALSSISASQPGTTPLQMTTAG